MCPITTGSPIGAMMRVGVPQFGRSSRLTSYAPQGSPSLAEAKDGGSGFLHSPARLALHHRLGTRLLKVVVAGSSPGGVTHRRAPRERLEIRSSLDFRASLSRR